MTKYGLLTYTTGNLGDDIQSLAAKRFLPRVDYFLDRDRLNESQLPVDEPVQVIMNGWYSHHPENFPPQLPQLKPLFLSVYIDEPVQPLFSSEANQEFFKTNAPIGARSLATQEFFEGLGIPTYFSGCLTLTLEPEPTVSKQDYILAIDLSHSVFDQLQAEADRPIIRMSTDAIHQYNSPEQRLKLAQYYLYLYQSASLVVTTRLHATLPCLALGTPVLNIEKPDFELGRFAGLRDLAHHLTEEAFLAGGYDVNRPLANPPTYLPLREQLIERCRAFTGFVSEKGYLDGQDPARFLADPDLLQLQVTGFWSAHQYYGIYR